MSEKTANSPLFHLFHVKFIKNINLINTYKFIKFFNIIIHNHLVFFIFEHLACFEFLTILYLISLALEISGDLISFVSRSCLQYCCCQLS